MSRQLVLEVPDELYSEMHRLASTVDLTAEILAIDWLMASLDDVLNDPLQDVIGSLHSQVPDWGQQHDELLTERLISPPPTQAVRLEDAA